MKLTQSQLQQLIKEELKTLLEIDRFNPLKPGALLELTVSDDGYETSFTELESAEEYTNSREGAYAPSVKMLVKVLQVAPDPDYETEPDVSDDASWGA